MKMKWSALSKYRLQIMGFATIYVVCFHFYEAVRDFDIAFNSLLLEGMYAFGQYGNLGVEIFLVLSGIGCCFSFRKNKDILSFYKKRFIRVLLPYTCIALPYWLIDAFLLNEGTIGSFLNDFFGISFWLKGTARFWYIFFILGMYLIFPWIYSCLENVHTRTKRFILLEIGSGVLTGLLWWILKDGFLMYEVMITRIPIYLLGVYIGFLVMSDKKVSLPFYFVCLFAFVTLFLKIKYPVFIIKRFWAIFQSMGIMFVFVLIYSFLNKIHLAQLVQWVLDWFGSHSLEVYLLHIAIRRIFLNLGLLQNNAHYYLYIVLFTVIIACIVKKVCGTIINGARVSK